MKILLYCRTIWQGLDWLRECTGWTPSVNLEDYTANVPGIVAYIALDCNDIDEFLQMDFDLVVKLSAARNHTHMDRLSAMTQRPRIRVSYGA